MAAVKKTTGWSSYGLGVDPEWCLLNRIENS